MLKTVCDQLPESDPDLATQATFSRLENSVSKKDLMRLSRGFLQRYVRSRKKRRPDPVILDLDSTDDHTHGQQEFSFYHGYYRNHILHPLLIFDAVTGDLVTVVLRPGNKGAASHIVPILKRIVKAIRREVGKELQIEIRADSGFATPRLYEFCESEENKLQYVIGLSRNPRLQRMVEPMLESTRLRFDEFEEKQRQFDEFLYRAGSWDRFRRVIVKVEVDHRGINRRFVVTNRDDLSSQSLYDHYTDRGQSDPEFYTMEWTSNGPRSNLESGLVPGGRSPGTERTRRGIRVTLRSARPDDPSGRALAGMLAVFAEFEHKTLSRLNREIESRVV